MMTTNKYFDLLKLSLLTLIFLFGATTLPAKTKDTSAVALLGADETYQIAARGLAKKMEADLVLNNIKVKFVKVERYAISRSQIGIRGAGSCQLGAEDTALPINFDVKINVGNRNVADVAYNFVDAEAESEETEGLTENETFVTRHLMEKIKADYKTENIVVAIDYLNENQNGGAKTLSGAGEVRLGDMIWKKISFEISADNQNSAAVKYKIQ